MKRFAMGVLYGVGGYLIAAIVSYVLVVQFSGNTHDRGVEAAMTSVFIAGPIGAVLAFAMGILGRGVRQKPPPATVSTQ